MFAGDFAADRVEGHGKIRRLALAPLDLGDHHHAFAVIDVDRKRRHRARSDEAARLLDGMLQILWVVVAAADDDQILEPAGHKEFTRVEEPEVAGAEVGSDIGPPLGDRPRIVVGLGEHGAEGRLRFVGTVPITLRHAGATHPDLTHAARGQRLGGLSIDDQHILAVEFASAADEPPRSSGLRRPRLSGAGLDRGRIKRTRHGRLKLHAAGDQQGAFGKAVARKEGLAAEAARGEGLTKRVDRLGADRLGPVEGQRPAGEVERGPLLGRRLPHAEFVGKVRAATDRGPVAGDRL